MGALQNDNEESEGAATASGRTFHGIAYGVFVGVLSLFSGIILLPIVASQVGSGPYGVWLFLISITTYVGYGDLGVTGAIIHFGARARGGDGERTLSELLSAGLIWSLLSMIVILPLYLWLAWQYTENHLDILAHSEMSQVMLVCMGGVVAFMAVVRPFTGALISTGLMVWTQRAAFATLIFRVVGTLVAVYTVGTVTAVALVETIATILPGVILMILVLTRVARVRFTRGMWPTLKLMLGYSTKSLTMGLSETVVLQGGTLIVGLVIGPASVTHFNLAYRVYNGVRQLMDWILEPFRSALSRIAVGARDAHLALIGTLSFVVVAIMTAGTAVWFLGSQFLVGHWVGDHMPAASIALVATVLLVGMLIESLHWPWILAADTLGMPGAFLLPQILWGVLFIPLGLYLGQHGGIVGVAVAMVLPLIVLEPVYLGIARRVAGLRVRDWWRQSLRPVAVLLAFPVAVAALTWLVTTMAAPFLTGWLPAVAFILGWLASAVVVRRHLPLDEVMAALRTRM